MHSYPLPIQNRSYRHGQQQKAKLKQGKNCERIIANAPVKCHCTTENELLDSDVDNNNVEISEIIQSTAEELSIKSINEEENQKNVDQIKNKENSQVDSSSDRRLSRYKSVPKFKLQNVAEKSSDSGKNVEGKKKRNRRRKT